MPQITLKTPAIERAVTAILKVRKQQLGDAIKTQSIDDLVRQGIQEELRAQAIAGTVGDDVKAKISLDDYWNATWRSYQGDDIPESLVAGLEAKAAAASSQVGA